MNTITNSELSAMKLHDQSVESFKIDFEQQEVYMKISVYNQETENYISTELVFKEVEGLKMDPLMMDSISSPEINSMNIDSYGNKTRIVWNLLLGHGKPSLEIQYLYDNCFKKE